MTEDVLAPPLDGIRVVDLTTFLSGPFGTQMLVDLGAEVIKVEPLAGDSSRSIPPHFVGDDSAYFLANNRSKRSVAIDLKDPDGLDAVRKLIATADVVVENFRPGVCERLGLDPKELRERQPELIWVSISGFGQVGPWKDKPAYDMIVQALSGVMSLTGEPEPGRPAVRLGIPAGDLVAGMFAAFGTLAAYIRRLRTGQGAQLDVSMLDSQLVMTSYQAVYAMLSSVTPGPQGARHDSIPTYRSFRGGDDREFVVTANTERMWQGLCRVIGRTELIEDARFATAGDRLAHRDELWPILEAAFAQRDAATWVELLEQERVPCALIKTVTEALDDARESGHDMVVELVDDEGHAVEVLGNPVRLVGSGDYEPQGYAYPPKLGEHSRELLREAGVADSTIDAMEQRGALGVRPRHPEPVVRAE
ncbi:CoA transferase [Aeromicrobium phragmitis]|uniref:CoA transferase n=1 Tax=Aeromicrobium phragmitis TaxID=2478914 RepID=A0A3L8PP72_9ACTN|nr:CoA transferase [Aeromicrobium phragmitis]RLV57130.1 CoA transferase [Aeromicrobium phragmitis]